MAKRGTLEHPKNLKLARRLGIMPCFSLGILEAIWHWAAKYARSGDLSGFELWQIAEAIRYTADEAELFGHLIECGWIDRDEDGSLTIHDWHEHADNAVKKTLANRGESFASGHPPFQKRNSHVESDDRKTSEISGKTNHNSGKFPRVCEPEPEPEPEPVIPPAIAAPKGAARKRFERPTDEEIAAYCVELGMPKGEGRTFRDYFDSNGWRVGGKAPMVDWRAAMRTWRRNWEQNNGHVRDGPAGAGKPLKPINIPAQNPRL